MNLTSIKLSIKGAHAWATVDGPLTSGMVGIPVTIEYDKAWDGLTKNLMCRCSQWGSNNGEIRTLLNVGDTSTVAHEVMQPDMYLYLGVEGFNDDGALVIPTTWARCGKIEYGANTCEDLSSDPELPIWNQLQTEVEQIKRDGYTQEQIDEIQDYVRSASQAAASAEKSKNNATAASNLAISNVNVAEIYMRQAQTSAENASTSAGSAANLANGALQAQRAAEAAAERAETAANSVDYTSLTNKPRINGVELNGDKTAEELGIGQPTDEQISGAVSDYLDAHPEATSTVGLRSICEEKVKFGAVHGLLLDDNLLSYLSNYDRLKLHTETAYGAYIQGQIAADGTVDTTKAGRVSEPFRCYPREVLHLSNQLTTKIAYYTAAMEFISTATMAAGVFEYTTPDNACWYRLQNQYSYGEIELITVRDKELKNRTFRDLILSPIKCRPTICFTGDSNTYGYGLSSVDKSWANLFISQLGTIGELTYGAFSKWVRCCGVIKYSSGYNCKSGAYMEFVTDAENVTLKIENNYSATWAWYVDGVTDSASDNMESIALDGGTHTVRVMFTGGQAADTKFVISKSITCINKAVSGVSTGNMVVERGCDWLIVMIGTNHRNENKNKLNMSLVEYTGKGSYVLPVPTHKVDESYTLSLFQSITTLTEMFEAFGFEIINCVPELSPVFSNTKYLQNDQIHFTEAGHIIICNTVSAKMGLPTYLTVAEAASA